MEYLRTADDAARLSSLLRSGTSGRALVVASIARATGRAYVDEVRLERALGEKVDVYVVSPEAGRALREESQATRHVFGGAAQAYAPVRGGRPVVSGPLRVAFGAADVDRMTNELIHDVAALTADPATGPAAAAQGPAATPGDGIPAFAGEISDGAGVGLESERRSARSNGSAGTDVDAGPAGDHGE